MPAHPDRVRRNYPEGAPPFGTVHDCNFASVYGENYYCIHCGAKKPVAVRTQAEEDAIRAFVGQWVREDVVFAPPFGERGVSAHHLPPASTYAGLAPSQWLDATSAYYQLFRDVTAMSKPGCSSLGHVFGSSAHCLFCGIKKPSDGR